MHGKVKTIVRVKTVAKGLQHFGGKFEIFFFFRRGYSLKRLQKSMFAV